LAAAAARDNKALLPEPDTLTLNKAALTTVLNSLIKKGLVAERHATADAPLWREDGDQRFTLVITTAGLEAIGIEPTDLPMTDPAAKIAPPVAAHPRSVKSDAVLVMLRRAEGASITEMNNVTNWQAHTIRGFLSGLRKKGLVVSRTKAEDGTAVYRVLEAAR
jgi:DNA-binding MarR family transcriptional regulator